MNSDINILLNAKINFCYLDNLRLNYKSFFINNNVDKNN